MTRSLTAVIRVRMDKGEVPLVATSPCPASAARCRILGSMPRMTAIRRQRRSRGWRTIPGAVFFLPDEAPRQIAEVTAAALKQASRS